MPTERLPRMGWRPQVVNRSWSSASHRWPSRLGTRACDGVQASDAYLVVVGDRGGWVTPSGALAVEEEFEEARKRSLPILAFLHEVSRDREGERLSRRVSDYVSGQFRRTFADPSDLQRKVADAVRGLITVVTLPRSDPDRALALLEPRERGPHEASVRLAVVPERVDELIPPDRLASQALVDEVYAIAHALEHSLLRLQLRKDQGVVAQWDPRSRAARPPGQNETWRQPRDYRNAERSPSRLT